MSDGKNDTGRSVKDVLAAIRARVQAEEAGLSAKPTSDGPPLRLDAGRQVEDDADLQPLQREQAAPLRLDTPSDTAPLKLGQDSALRLDAPVASPPVEEVPEAPHVQIDDVDEDRPADNVTPLFASQPEVMTIETGVEAETASEVIAEIRDGIAAEDGEKSEPIEADFTPDPIAATAAEYDIWTPAPDAPDAEYDVWTPQAYADPLPDRAEIGAEPDANDLDTDAVRAIVMDVIAEQPSINESQLRSEIRAILADEIDKALGGEFVRALRKSIRKDIVRAFKERGLN